MHAARWTAAGVLRDGAAWRDGIARAETEVAARFPDRLEAAQALDCADWLPNDLLIKLDRCLMAHGVEGRTPFLDPAVADVAFRLPQRMKVRRRLGKWLLRRWLADHAPAAMPYSRKRGFTVPVGAWISEKGRELAPLVAAQPGIEELCKPDAVRALFEDSGSGTRFAAWTLLFYALWHNHHVVGRRADGDAFDALGTN